MRWSAAPHICPIRPSDHQPTPLSHTIHQGSWCSAAVTHPVTDEDLPRLTSDVCRDRDEINDYFLMSFWEIFDDFRNINKYKKLNESIYTRGFQPFLPCELLYQSNNGRELLMFWRHLWRVSRYVQNDWSFVLTLDNTKIFADAQLVQNKKQNTWLVVHQAYV